MLTKGASSPFVHFKTTENYIRPLRYPGTQLCFMFPGMFGPHRTLQSWSRCTNMRQGLGFSCLKLIDCFHSWQNVNTIGWFTRSFLHTETNQDCRFKWDWAKKVEIYFWRSVFKNQTVQTSLEPDAGYLWNILLAFHIYAPGRVRRWICTYLVCTEICSNKTVVFGIVFVFSPTA